MHQKLKNIYYLKLEFIMNCSSVLCKKDKEFNGLIDQLRFDDSISKASIPVYKDSSISAKLVITRRSN